MAMSEKERAFEAMLAEQPGANPLELARIAGYEHPERFLARRAAKQLEAEQKEPDPASPGKLKPLTERDRAKRTLRHVAHHGEVESARVAAARALLDLEPPMAADINDRVLVVFRGREPMPNTKTHLIANDITPEELAAAIEHVQRKRAAAEERELAEFAAERGLNPEDVQLAWGLFSDHEARSAALRVYMMKHGQADES